MSVNKYKLHVHLIPEDDANRQLVVGFLDHAAVNDRVVNLAGPAGGWPKVLKDFETVYLPLLRQSPLAHVVMLIDFDEDVEDRSDRFNNAIPGDVKDRVFVIGSRDKPETLKRTFSMSLERIGQELAQDCLQNDLGRWVHPQLNHNSSELQRMVKTIKPIVFH